MEDEIYSIGVDIGTSTTEVIISKLKIEQVLGTSLIKETVIKDKKIIYKSPIAFTPLIDDVTIDFVKIRDIIEGAFKQSGIEKCTISTGAVIITGETARKENANEVSRNLSEYLGNFVVATAGPKLESLLAGYGSGAADLAKKLNRRVINLDIGGGTTNAAVFNCDQCEQTFALDIGGRLIKFDCNGNVIYISERIKFLIDGMKLDIRVGDILKFKALKALCEKLAKCLLEVCCLSELSEDTRRLFISEEFRPFLIDHICFSGGVGEYIGKTSEDIKLEEVLIHNDIGPFLAACISNEFENHKKILISPKEKIRATVIGAGNHSLTLSGSTITFDKAILPLKNIPIVKPFSDAEDIREIYKQGKKKVEIYEDTKLAISLKGPKSPSYEELKIIGKQMVKLFEEIDGPIIVILENDFGKALGQVISLAQNRKREVICLDKICTKNGDYIDIGLPIGNAIPVVIKTLIYNS